MKKSKEKDNKNRIADGVYRALKYIKARTGRLAAIFGCVKNALKRAQRFVVKIPAVLKKFFKGLPFAAVRFAKEIPFAPRRFASLLLRAAKRLFEEYRHWLYNDKIKKVSPNIKTENGRIFSAIVSAVLFVTFGLYYMGVYDIGIIDRPEAWLENGEKLAALFSEKIEEAPEPVPEEQPLEPVETAKPVPTVQSVDLKYTLRRRNDSTKINSFTVFKTDSELESEGYYLTDAVYDENTCEIGIMSFDYDLPEYFSYRKMKVRDWKITEYDDGRAAVSEETETETDRPAIYLYMGYIIYDDGRGGMYLADSNGTLLMKYDDSYIPAMARNRSGQPLFYKNYTFYADAPVSYEINEAGEEVVTGTRGVTLKGKNYFCLSGSGNRFTADDYIEERDGRGLNFDFTSGYGVGDGKIIRVGIMTPKISTFLNGKSGLVNFMNWNYFLKNDPSIPVLDDIIAREISYKQLTVEEKLEAIETMTAPSDVYNVEEMLPYSFAYNYSGGYASVVTGETGEDPKYETEELRVINTYGEVMFNSKKIYYNSSFKNYCSDRYLLPLSKGEDSVGHLYFDHGLLRLRKVCYDNYQLEEFGDFRVNSDEDVLVYPNGREFPIPAGYKLHGYSDGIMVLEKNGLYGYMDYTGRWIADPKYKNAAAFHGGIGVVTDISGKMCAFNTNGDYVLPMKYDYIQNRSDGLIAAYSEEDGWQVYGIFTR